MPKIQTILPNLCISVVLLLSTTPAKAQITPDNTLGAERSNVVQNTLVRGANADLINGGAQRGRNLFHSFSDFNVNPGQSVYFANPSDVTNILTRVTGGNRSIILGTLGVDGVANLFLINPAGILFGSGAKLDLRGSFVGTTANGVQFGNQGLFSATNPQAPPLLTIDPSGLLFNQLNQGARITNQSTADAGVDLTGERVTGLRVPDGKSLLLVGGDVVLNGGTGLTATGGRVELASLAAPGTVGLNVAGDTLSLSLPSNVQQGNISLTNQAFVDVSGAGGGDITVNAGNLAMSNSYLFAGIGTGLGNGSRAGDININADSISLLNGAAIGNYTLGKGDAVNIFITARDRISLDGGYIYSAVQSSDAVGNAGNINIATGSLFATNGGQINSFTRGRGNAGNITIQARDAVTFDGVDNSNGISSGVFSNVQAGGLGNGGNINLTAGSLSLTNGGELRVGVNSASSNLPGAQGFAGTVNVNVRDVLTISGTDTPGIFAGLGTGAVGRGGDINVQAGSILVKDGGRIASFTLGRGNAGNITIQARDAVTFDGVDNSKVISSGSFSSVEAGAIGNGGNINITAGSLSLTNGGELSVAVRGQTDTLPGAQSNAGSVNINVRDALTISGTDTPGIFAGLGTGAVGRGGDINVQAESILVKDGGRIASFTLGRGNAGNITIQARDAVTFDGVDNSKVISSGSFSSVEAGAIGNGGNINITAGSLSLTNGGELSVAVRGQTDTLPGAQSNAGSVNINVRDALTISGTDTPGIFANLGTGAVGRGGDIKLQAGNVFLKDDGQISSSTFGKGDAGNISITAREAISLDAGVISAVQGSSTLGNGGNITFSTGSLSASHGGQINSFIRGRGNAGNITILAKDAVSFDGVDSSGNPSGLFSSVLAGAIGNGGNINITAGSLSLTNGGELGVNVRGNTGTLPGAQSNGGSVNINVRDALTISGSGSQISSSLGTGAIGRGGDINVLARSFSVSNNAQVTTSSFGRGNAGNLTVAANSINLDKGQLLANSQSGLGGNVFLTVSDLILMRHNSLISNTSGTTQNPGQEGKLTLNTKFLVAAPLENNDIITNAFSGSGGKINITATEGLFGFVVRNGNYSSENINLLQKNNINDIAASSNSGTPNIDTRVNDITQGLIEIPVKVSDVTSKFSQLCPNTANPKKKPLGSFVITGKGSIPPNPLELLPGRNPDIPLATAEDMQEIKNIQAQEQKKKEEQEHNTKVGRKKNKDNTLPSIVEAQGIVQTPDGQIYFVANANHATPSSQPTASPCPSQN